MALQKRVLTNGGTFTPTTHTDTYPAIHPIPTSALNFRIFITGASKGIGRATALAYAKAGASHIGLGARSSLTSLEREIREVANEAGRKDGGPKVLSVGLDVADQESVEKAAGVVEREFEGKVDVLVNNAGYLEEWKAIGESVPEEWWRSWEVNIRGPYLMTRSFLPLLLASEQKTIINITSRGAHGTSYGGSAYQTTKFALLRLSEFTNVEYGERGVLTYSVHPGGVMTELAQGMPEAMQDRVLTDKVELASDTLVYLTQSRQEWLAGRYISAQWDMPELFGMKEKIAEKDLLRVRMAVE